MNEDRFIGRIFELSNERQITGRRKIKIVLHEIFPSHDVWQENGISWDEEYTTQNIESVTNMSICVEFLSEERRLPYGHGLTDIKDNMPYMEDATVVGHCEKGYVTDIEIDGETKECLSVRDISTKCGIQSLLRGWLKAKEWQRKGIC